MRAALGPHETRVATRNQRSVDERKESRPEGEEASITNVQTKFMGEFTYGFNLWIEYVIRLRVQHEAMTPSPVISLDSRRCRPETSLTLLDTNSLPKSTLIQIFRMRAIYSPLDNLTLYLHQLAIAVSTYANLTSMLEFGTLHAVQMKSAFSLTAPDSWKRT